MRAMARIVLSVNGTVRHVEYHHSLSMVAMTVTLVPRNRIQLWVKSVYNIPVVELDLDMTQDVQLAMLHACPENGKQLHVMELKIVCVKPVMILCLIVALVLIFPTVRHATLVFGSIQRRPYARHVLAVLGSTVMMELQLLTVPHVLLENSVLVDLLTLKPVPCVVSDFLKQLRVRPVLTQPAQLVHA